MLFGGNSCKGDLGDWNLQPEWGEFFPFSISPFGYNETIEQEYFPLTKEDVESRQWHDSTNKFKWSDYEPEFPKVEKIIPANLLPETILEIPDDILNWAVKCKVTGKPFKIIKSELEFYRKMNLPIPTKNHDSRYKERAQSRGSFNLFDSVCQKCNQKMVTTYSPNTPEIVYCEKCYLASVY